jgi:TRAP-type C4-dicarboxylate transport system permease small subunit
MQSQHHQDPAAAALAHTPEASVDPTEPPGGDGEILAAPRRRPVTGRNAVVRAAEALSYHVARATALLSLLMALTMIASLLVQVFFRYVLNDPLAWTDEAAIFCFAWTTLLLASIGVRERTHVRFTFVVDLVPRGVAAMLDLVIMVLIAVFGVIFITTGQELVDLVWGNLSPAVHYPVQYLYLSIPIVGALFILHAGTNLLIGVPRLPAGEPVP